MLPPLECGAVDDVQDVADVHAGGVGRAGGDQQVDQELQTPGDLRRRAGVSEQVVDANHHHVALRVTAEGAVREVQTHQKVLQPVP